jgi:phosphohistidine phosphatase
MKNLFLIRHAQAEKFSETNLDIDRKLTSEGMRVASLLGKYLHDEGVVPDAIVCSPAERARMTAELVAGQVGYGLSEIQIVEGLYQASVRELVDFLSNFSQKFKTVMLVGHNPTLTYTADYLCEEEISGMNPGSVIHIAISAETWTELSVKGGGDFINYYDVLSEH